jgi:hypothetical protein
MPQRSENDFVHHLTALVATNLPGRQSTKERITKIRLQGKTETGRAAVRLQEPGRRSADKPLTKDEVRRTAANIAKLPELLGN